MRTIEIRALPISLELARRHLRVSDANNDNELIVAKTEMAVGIAEDMTGRIIREKVVQFDVLIPAASSPIVCLPVHTMSIEQLSVSHASLPEEDYTFLPGDYDSMLITNPRYAGQHLTVRAVVGYNCENIPPAIKAAILLILGTLYDNESDNIVGRSVSELSLTAEKLLSPWRVSPYREE